MNQQLAAVLVFLLSPFIIVTQIHAAVVINEIAPKYTDPTWEWVELYNTDSASVSLDRWKLDHSAGDGTSYILNASFVIEPHGFLTLSTSQTAIAFSVDGDTVRLFNQNGSLVDSKSYPGTLGYNTSMGRSTDGGDGWVICTPDPYTATPGKANMCPPAPTATPVPTSTATPTPAPTPTPPRVFVLPTLPPIQSLQPTQQTFGSIMATPTPFQVLGVETISPTPTPPADVLQFAIARSWIAYMFLGIAAAALALMLTLWLRQRRLPPKGK